MGSKPIGISASRSSAILGVSKYKTPLEIWLEMKEIDKPGFCKKNGYTLPESAVIDCWAEPRDPRHASMRWGLALEGGVEYLDRWNGNIEGGMLASYNIFSRERLCETTTPHGVRVACHIDGVTKVFRG